ncbi:alpha/beta hydrolase [Amylibacter marinus]|uniref:Alpha/beta hydrolase n=1 Tax=Amylibacter marinus TaxID=1475483 RepID=A0ABQ5VU27_9RHOB|nr:alpha/beta hydrolase [Amylibacter marinus]GLQ34947.1 alpha/beta hydrolase [Amylibacter marinus]
MSNPQHFTTPQGREIAYHQTTGTEAGPGVVFLGGFKSDMQGSKALYLQEWAEETGRAFLRFDYSGHGQSSGEFRDGSIGEWAEDAQAAVTTLTTGPQILVGSSMGGWISLLLAKRIPDQVAGLVGIAAAPDFTEDSMWNGMSSILQAKLMKDGVIYQPSEYDEPYPITKKLITDGRNHLVLREDLELPFPVRLLHGTADADVHMDVALRLLEHASGDDIRLNFVKGADHRFSDARCLQLIRKSIHSILMA